jgi:WD40 repeat protein
VWSGIGPEDRLIWVGDLTTGKVRGILRGHEMPMADLAVAPDGSWLVSADTGGVRDGTIMIWDLHSMTLKRTLRGHRRRVNAVAPHPVDECLASVGNDGTVRVWDVATGSNTTFVRVDDSLHACQWAPDGRGILVGGQRGLYFFELSHLGAD